MKNILIPIDDTDASWKTVRCILSLYTEVGMRFYILNTVVEEESFEEVAVLRKTKCQNYDARFTGLQTALKTGQKLITLQWKGNFVRNVQDATLEYDIDLIVLRNRKNRKETISSNRSFQKEIITRVKCAIFILPEVYDCKHSDQMVVLTDYSFTHRSRATNTLLDFVQHSGAHLHVLQQNKMSNVLSIDQTANKSFLHNAIESVSHSFHFVIDKTMDQALQFFINLHKVDVVVLFAKHINYSESFLFSPENRERIDYYKHVPFLIIHE